MACWLIKRDAEKNKCRHAIFDNDKTQSSHRTMKKESVLHGRRSCRSSGKRMDTIGQALLVQPLSARTYLLFTPFYQNIELMHPSLSR